MKYKHYDIKYINRKGVCGKIRVTARSTKDATNIFDRATGIKRRVRSADRKYYTDALLIVSITPEYPSVQLTTATLWDRVVDKVRLMLEKSKEKDPHEPTTF